MGGRTPARGRKDAGEMRTGGERRKGGGVLLLAGTEKLFEEGGE
jgi:hypothetical protein